MDEEIKALIEAGLAEVKGKVDSATSASAEEVKSLNAKIEGLTTQLDEAKSAGATLEYVEKMQLQLDKLDMKLQKKTIQNGTAASLDSELKSMFSEKSFSDQIELLKKSSGNNVNLDVKAATSITLGSYAGTSLTTEIDRSIVGPQTNMPFFRDIVNVAPISCVVSQRY